MRPTIQNGAVDPIVWRDLVGVRWRPWGRAKADGFDCFGLVLEVQRRLGRTVRDVMDYDPVNPGRAIVDRACQWRRLERSTPGCAISLEMEGNGIPDHVGVMIDERTVLHTMRGGAGVVLTRVEVFDGRVHGFFEPVGPTVHAVVVLDPLTHQSVEDYVPWREGMTVRGMVPDGLLSDETWARTKCWVNAEAVGTDAVVPAGAEVILWVHPGIPVPAALVASTGLSAGTLAIIGNVAISVALALVSQLIAAPRPAQVDKSKDDGRPGFSLDGVRNTTANGTTCPVVYGRTRFAGQVLQLFTEQDDQFRSTLYMLVSVGEGKVHSIGGITQDSDRLNASAINGTDIEINGNKVSAFPSARVSIRLGNTRQSPIPGFDRTVVEFGQNLLLRATNPLVGGQAAIPNNDQTFSYTTTQAVDGFALAIEYGIGLYKVDLQTGSEVDYSVYYTLRYQRKGQPATMVTDVVIHGPSALKAVHTRAIKKIGLTRDVYEIWLTRMSDNDENLQRRFSTSTLKSVREYVSDNPVAYNSRALYALEIPATAQLSGGVPTLSAVVEGKEVYQWDGVSTTAPAFTFGYTNNPAWIMFDMILNRRYGGGVHATLNDIDLPSFKALADYCATSITTDGVTHERWAFNAVFDTQGRLWDQLAIVAASCRCSFFLSGSKWKISIDQYTTPTQMFSSGNIIAGTARRRFLPTWRRPNVMRAQYPNRNLNWDSDVAQLASPTVPSGSDFIIEDAQFHGLDRPEQVYRALKYLLNFSQFITEAVQFSVPVDAVVVEPGDAFWFESESVRPGGYGGRMGLDAPDTTHVYLDRDITITAGAWSFAIIQNDAVTGVETMSTVSVVTGAGTYTAGTLIQIGALPYAAKKFDTYMIGPSATYRGEYRVTALRRNPDQTVDIDALIQNASVYSDDPGVIESFTDVWPDTRRVPGNPTGLRLVERIGVSRDGIVVPGVDVSFVPEQEGLAHDIWVRPMYDAQQEQRDAAPYEVDIDGRVAWFHAGTTSSAQFSVDRGLSFKQPYEFSITVRGPAGTRADPRAGATGCFTPIGKTDAPTAPTNVQTFAREGGLLVTWTPSTDYDIDHYEIRQASQDGRKFFLSQVLAKCACGDRAFVVPHTWNGTRYVQVTAVSRSGVRSMLPAYATMPSTPDGSRNVATNTSESVAWPGTKTNMAVTGSVVRANLGSTTGSYQTGDTTHALIQRQSTLHILVDATVMEIDTTIDQAGYGLTSPHAQRLTLDGVLLDAPDPDQILSLEDNDYPLDSPGSRTNLINGSIDWDATVTLKIEYDLAQDAGATVWDGFKEYKGPIPISGRYYCRVRLSWTTATGGDYRVQFEELRVQCVAQVDSPMTWGNKDYSPGANIAGAASLTYDLTQITNDTGPTGDTANAGVLFIPGVDKYFLMQATVPQDLDVGRDSMLRIVALIGNPLGDPVGNQFALECRLSASEADGIVGAYYNNYVVLTAPDNKDDNHIVVFEGVIFPAGSILPGHFIAGTIRRNPGGGDDTSSLFLKVMFVEFVGYRIPTGP